MFENNVYVQNFNKYTFLLTELIKRDISGKYKDSTLGLFWSFLNPLLSMIVLTMVFSLIFANTIENFPVYLLSGKLVFVYLLMLLLELWILLRQIQRLLRRFMFPNICLLLELSVQSLLTF